MTEDEFMSDTEYRVDAKMNTAAAPEHELDGVIKMMHAAKKPGNRIYEAMIQQMDLLRFEYQRKKDRPLTERDAANLNEKFATINKLAEFYLKSKENRQGIGEEETKQIETVHAVRDVLTSQSRYMDRVLSKEKDPIPQKEPAASGMQGLPKETGVMEYSDAIRKSSEAAFSAMRELGVLSVRKESEEGKKFTETEKDLTRLGMTAIMLYDRIMAGEEGQKFYESYVKPQKDYGKVITSIANSPEFKQAVEEKYGAKQVKDFLVQKDAPKKLWDSFEQNVKKQGTIKAKEEQKEKTGQKEKATGLAL